MINIDTSNWKEYLLSDIFSIKKTQNITSEEAEQEIGSEIPYVTRSSLNNGVNFFVKKTFNLNPANSITIAGEGASVFYQEKSFITGNNINILISKKLNKFSALFIITILNLEKYRYSYNRAFNKTCISKTKIKLPADKEGNPNWKYMESYVKQLFSEEREINELSKNLINKKNNLKDKVWKYFKISNIAPIKKVKKLSSIPLEIGPIPFISSSSQNQGIASYSSFISNNGPSITVSTNGSCFDCFYHNGKIGVSTDVEVLDINNISKYAAIFIVSVLKMEKFKWTYGRKPKKGLVNKTKILLPVDKNNNPDWDFMENYIKSLPYSKFI